MRTPPEPHLSRMWTCCRGPQPHTLGLHVVSVRVCQDGLPEPHNNVVSVRVYQDCLPEPHNIEDGDAAVENEYSKYSFNGPTYLGTGVLF